jgi:thiosulfate/3-mercaptopyruvate sulfurtransferase
MTLISVDALAELIDDAGAAGVRGVRIVDVRWYLGRPGAGRTAYDGGHIPGAIHLDLDADLSGPAGPGRHPLPEPAAFAARLGAVGIGTNDRVVVYDDAGGWVAPRLWWMLDNLGHAAVEVLDGGLPAWIAAGHPLTTEPPAIVPATMHLADRWSGIVDRDALRARLGRVVLLDARAAPRYRGETEPVDPVAGHIPTALNRPTDANLGPDWRFLPPDELRRAFRELGAEGDREVVTSCGSGTSACHHSIAMRLAGLPDPILYVGSWSDWSRAGYPVATGPDPGEPA